MQYMSEQQINQVKIGKVQMLGSHKFGTPKAGRKMIANFRFQKPLHILRTKQEVLEN